MESTKRLTGHSVLWILAFLAYICLCLLILHAAPWGYVTLISTVAAFTGRSYIESLSRFAQLRYTLFFAVFVAGLNWLYHAPGWVVCTPLMLFAMNEVCLSYQRLPAGMHKGQ